VASLSKQGFERWREELDFALTGARLRALQLFAYAGAAYEDNATLPTNIAPLQSDQLSGPEPGPEGELEQMAVLRLQASSKNRVALIRPEGIGLILIYPERFHARQRIAFDKAIRIGLGIKLAQGDQDIVFSFRRNCQTGDPFANLRCG
jgi:hypothetical protein